jgi:hypothetical protein
MDNRPTQPSNPYPAPTVNPQERARQNRHVLLVLGVIGAILLVVCIGVAGISSALGLGNTASATATTGNQQQVVFHSTATAKPAATPKPKPTVTPKPKPTATPKPQPTATSGPQPTATPCPGVNCNPWGYNFTSGNYIYNPPSNFCDYFNCIPNFWNSTNGYVVECNDDTYSHSGGRSGACSYHGGVYRALLS